MSFWYAIAGDALVLSALAWFAGYGALGPATGIRLRAADKVRLFAEVYAITASLLLLFINVDRVLGWAHDPPWAGEPPPHRLLAIGALLTTGFVYARRRSRALDIERRSAQSDEPDRDRKP